MASNNSTPPLTVDSLNPTVLKCEYVVRGEIGLWLRNYSKICKQIQVLILLRRYCFLCVFF
ncbi:putative alanine transaminase [Helianthus anomalus]